MGDNTETDPRQRLDAFVESSGLGEAFSKISASERRRRGVLVGDQNWLSHGRPCRTLGIRHWHDGFEHAFRVIVGIDKDNQIFIKINLKRFTKETLPTETELHELLIDQFGKPIKKQLH